VVKVYPDSGARSSALFRRRAYNWSKPRSESEI
jgi:hypothetical protein